MAIEALCDLRAAIIVDVSRVVAVQARELLLPQDFDCRGVKDERKRYQAADARQPGSKVAALYMHGAEREPYTHPGLIYPYYVTLAETPFERWVIARWAA